MVYLVAHVGGQGGVVEATAQVGVAVFVESDGDGSFARVDLDVGGRQRGVALAVGDLQLAVGLDDLRLQLVGVGQSTIREDELLYREIR